MRPDPDARTTGARASRRTFVLAAAVLGAVAVAVALVAVFGGDGGGRHTTSRASVPTVASGAYVGDVGDVSDASAVRALLAQPSVVSAERTRSTSADHDLGRDGTAALRCARTLEDGTGPRRGNPVVLLATARYRTKPAFVAAVHRGARTIVFVMDRRDCSVLVSQSQ